MLQMQDSSEWVCCEEAGSVASPKNQPCSESLGGYFKHALTNLTYNLKHSNYFNIPGLLREVVVIEEGGSPAYLLGREYGYEAKEQFVAHFRSTIWFSYRKNIPAVGDDTGWGCMIRSAMMMVAEAAKRSTGMQPVNVLKHFKEKENGMYSFAALCKQGNINNRWSTSSEIAHVCDRISREDFSLGLNIVNVPFSCLIVSDVENEILKRRYQSTLIVLHLKLGLHSAEKQFLPHLKMLMKLPYFCGLLGGIPRQAMYILGFKDEKVICLDPHYVQDQNESDQSYFKQHPRGLDYQKLSSCVSVSFFVSNLQEFSQLVKQLFLIDKQVKEGKAMGLLLAEVLKQQFEQQYEAELKNGKARKLSSDDFELLE